MRKTINILGVNFDVVSSDETLLKIDGWLSTSHSFFGFRKQYYIVTPNPEILLEAQKNPEFKDILNNADLSIPDGIGVLWASKFQKIAQQEDTKWKRFGKWIASLGMIGLSKKYIRTELPERVTGVDLMERMCLLAAEKKHSIFLLGAADGVAEKTAEKLKQKYPELQIVSTFAGTPNEGDDKQIVEYINAFKPELLFVAYGAPKQELWIDRNLKHLDTVKVAIGVGGAFDFISGLQKRAPKFFQKYGIEWMYRLYRQPTRAKRIWNAVVKFPIKIYKAKIDK